MIKTLNSVLLGALFAAACSQIGISQTRLNELSRQFDQQWKKQRAVAESVANVQKMPVRVDRADGSTFELQRIENGLPRYYLTENINAAKTISTDKVWPTGGFGFSLSGSGITLGEWDAGMVRATHQEFGTRVTSTEGALNFHSTHVAGTMVAAGVSPTRKGMSSAGTLKSYDWNNDNAEMAAQAAAGLRVSNHSYGLITGWYYNYFGDSKWAWFGDPVISTVEDYRFGFYDAEAGSWDAIAVNAPYYLMVKAAGNDRNEGPGTGATLSHWVFVGGSWILQTVSRNQDGNSGYDCIEGAGIGKNVLTVGAVDDLASGYVNAAGVTMSTFSCWGPTDDGRIKPDIVANGVGLSSTFETADNAYGTLNGTSMATPNATGSIGLLLEYHNSLHNNTLILSSTMKGLIIHTADEAGTAPGPDYRFGWGLMNTLKAAQLMRKDSADGFTSHIKEILMHNHDTVRLLVGSDGLQELRATLSWTDAAGTVSAPSLDPTTIKLINDFDLRIIKRIDLTTSSPWILNPSVPTSAATTGDNIRDNVEQVLIPSPVKTNYIVQITHKGTLGSPQYVSLILSGNIPPLGSSIAVLPDSLDIALPPTSVKFDSLLISNSSDSTLFYHVSISPSSAGWLSVTHQDSGSVPPASSRYFGYTIDATALSQWKTYSGLLNFTSNDLAHPLLPLDIDLSTLGPKLFPDPSAVTVDVDSGNSGTQSLLIINTGTNPLIFAVTDSSLVLPPWLSLNKDTGTVAPGDTVALVITAGDTILPIGDYRSTLTIASNDSLDGAIYIAVNLHVGTRNLFYANMANQWNLLSLPVRPLNVTKHSLYPTAISAAFSYKGNYIAKETLRVGQGFWLKFGSAQPVGFDGYTVSSAEIDVNAGWNIIGSISIPVPLSTISSVPGGIVTSKFYGYEGTYVSTDTIKPGKAYWVKTTTPGQLVLSGSAVASPSNGIHILPTNELPPTPPGGGTADEVLLPARYALEQNFPNPFNPLTRIGYALPSDEWVTLKVYNVLGTEVAGLVDEYQHAGYKAAEWNASNIPSGVYFYKLTAGAFTFTKKMILIK